ncbi:LysM peptidoglycan-binding domain-containing protein [Mariprofundus erugo]|uniref:LysM peptidoglycan-binding domain-containing protein n=1 Tax=Mariprofundus erugo TaxID=2528639 RepID=A0A5R9GSV7_9PROT|nr:LysM peptidoglycan-binding domain-containing protein [Mariprofundus erugo]TLS67523.1 LysM peptidoglycan-binding domain-containing protein [Mariprofundus erugo]TLS76188.1 LysM peptidoglycan-binding domain-containing protein [Mariprofundus erugo]
MQGKLASVHTTPDVPAAIVQPATSGVTDHAGLTEASRPLDPLLAGLSDEDINKAKLLARHNFRRSWKVIGERSRFVRHRMLETLEQLGAPLSLQVVPAVESTYNPYAVSQSGALGLWQLMPRTAHGLGVDSNDKTNGRRSIADSTRAAVVYLQQLHDRFDSWPLAFAAYNLGPNAVAHRLEKSPWNESDGLEHLPIPQQTRLYVQHIIGLAALVEENEFTFPGQIRTRTIELNTPVDIHRLATLSGMDENEIFRYNPCLNQAQYLKKPITIHVPESHYQQVADKVQMAGPQYVMTTVRKGDSLWSIARAHHITVDMLKNLNKGIGKVIHIGLQLKVPAGELATASSARANPLLPVSRQRLRYTVRQGDSLWLIANRFGTTPQEIARYNGLRHNGLIRAGDTLWVKARISPS